MSSKELALAAKTRGNEAFTKGDYTKAVEEFSEAIKHDPSDAIFYSNRSGAFASLKQYEKALEDATKCIELKPDFIKGYSRKGVALFGMKNYTEAEKIYQQGLKLDSNNAQLKEGLEEVNKAMDSSSSAANPFGQMFGPDMWVKLQGDPTTRGYLTDPSYVAKLNQLQKDPKLIQQYLSDPKISASLGVLLGMGSGAFNFKGDMPTDNENKPKFNNNTASNTGGATVEDEDDDEEMNINSNKSSNSKPAASTNSSSSSNSSSSKPAASAPAAKKEVTPADKEKELGNAAYLKKNFTEALEHYNKAIELSPNNIVYYNNVAAVYAEQKDYEKAIETCKKGIEIGQQHGANFKDVAKAYFRIGNVLASQDKIDEALEYYNKSQVEDYNDKTKQAIKKLESIKKQQEEKAYINPELSEVHKTKGNELFQAGKWVDAIAEYTEALKRDPTNYKVLSNRAACYTKLMDWQRGLEDCENCLKQDSKFVKAYIRKGKIQHFLKQYHKALETYNTGLTIDPNASELLEGKRQTLAAINSGEVDPERAQRAMQDPEIQAILKDPTINKVLADLQSNPAAGQAALKDADIRGKIEKLIAAGVLAVK